jgi:beta-lactamase superfamily II metal-dependent hydrolase
MTIEIDMLDVANADSIIIQVYDGKEHASIVIDGGNASDGDIVLQQLDRLGIRSLDLIINTHPDADHIDGLRTLIDGITVGQVWIHDPSEHKASERMVYQKLSEQQFSSAVFEYKSLTETYSLIDFIDSRGIKRLEPFAGLQFRLPGSASIEIVGPSVNYYEDLLEHFEDKARDLVLNEVLSSVQEAIKGLKTQQTPEEIIDEKNDESPTNNSSVLTLIRHSTNSYLFTGDAGPDAFNQARIAQNLSGQFWMQIPHHGSRRNLTTELIKYFSPRVGFVSAKGGEDQKHPNPALVTVLKNAGCLVYGTNKSGSLLHHSPDANPRPGYDTAEPL